MIDMHIHTNNSDGDYTTQELIQKLIELKIELFSITDHDNFDSCKQMKNIILPENMIYIPGIELSSRYERIDCHILGYYINHESESLIEECRLIRRKRQRKIMQVLKYIRENYRILTEQEEQEILYKNGTIGRTDICKLLIKKGYGERKKVYEKYLSPKDLLNHRSDSKKIIEVIHEAGGIAILAHPGRITNINIEEFIKKLIEQGLDGIEVYNSVHTKKEVKKYIEIAKKYNLLTTGGSDFHGKLKPNIILGTTTQEHIKIKKQDINFQY